MHRSLITRHASLFLFVLLIAGCAIPYVPYRSIYEDPVNYVRLEEDDAVLPEWPPGHHAHPKPLSVEQITRLLNGMTVKEHRIWLQKWFQGEAPLVPAFKAEEVVLLAPQLAEAFAAARYNERVTFYLSQPQTSVKRVITSGGMYVHDDRLHVLLGNWQIVYGIPTYGMIYDRRYPMRPTAAKGFDLFFEPAEAVVKQRSSIWDTIFANTKDELVIDMTRWQSSMTARSFSPALPALLSHPPTRPAKTGPTTTTCSLPFSPSHPAHAETCALPSLSDRSMTRQTAGRPIVLP